VEPPAPRQPSAMLAGALGWMEWEHVALVVLVWTLLTAGSLAIVLRIVLALPADYFEVDQAPRTRWTVSRLARNLIGVLLIGLGTILAIPGVPGQGVLTILVGLFLVDFPRRRELEQALARRPGVLATLNQLRTRFQRAPLRPPPPRPES
jgi:hypothetical protein